MPRVILAAVAVAVLLIVALSMTRQPAGGRFAEDDTCSELLAHFEAVPVSNDPAERKEVGDEYRARFRELDCEL